MIFISWTFEVPISLHHRGVHGSAFKRWHWEDDGASNIVLRKASTYPVYQPRLVERPSGHDLWVTHTHTHTHLYTNPEQQTQYITFLCKEWIQTPAVHSLLLLLAGDIETNPGPTQYS